MRQKLILHIGTHKTGSTTIQHYLYYNRLWLRKLGVFYPRPINGSLFYANNHSDLRDTAQMEGRPRGAEIHPEFGPHDALVGRYMRQIKDAGCPVSILSAEGWSSHLNRYARRLAPLTQHFDVKVVAFLRRPDLWVEKFYSQRIANIEHRETRSFADFITQPHMETYLFNRNRMMNWWARSFGQEAVEVIPFEPNEPDFDLIGHFLEACDVPDGMAHRLFFRNAKANPTLSPANAEAVRQRLAAGEPVSASWVRQLKRQNQHGSGGYLSLPERQSILARAEPDLQKICEAFVRDRRTTMFKPPTDAPRSLALSG